MMMTARQHALLFAFISKSVVQETGVEKGESLIRKAVREMKRQIESSLYERLALSRDKEQIRIWARCRCMLIILTGTSK